jgi:hypothetical protein
MFKSLPSFKVKSLPQAIGLPFLSTQEDAQLKFRSGEGGIKRLYGDEVGWVGFGFRRRRDVWVSFASNARDSIQHDTFMLLRVKKQLQGILLSLVQVIPLNDVGYWAQYYSLFSSTADVYSLISVQDGECTTRPFSPPPHHLSPISHVP